ncbi:hypothetical protein BKA62DRAFT_19321 [Auriculariales sp. MPI-PUGE-AT-0066]|nr:hypothetical protein BKA62DRAFT_19321 [Auriculariales sp. MPI-PUGE-AT-0066]
MFGCVPAPGHCPSCTTPKPPTAPPCASCNPPKPLNPPPCVACTSPKPTTLPPCTICNPPKPPAPCPSSPSKRSSDIRVESTLRADVSSKCPSPRQACAANHGYDCLDVSTSLTNCGGCTKPLFDDQPRGVDCTSLDGAEVVQCKLGTCEVGKCGDGYKVHRDGSSCTKFDVDVKSQLSSSTRSSIIATNSSTGAAVGVLESTAETTVASDNDAIAGRHLEDWKRTDAATSAAADLLADLLGQHAGLFTESFTETILRRRQLKDHMYAPVIADASSAFTTVSDVSLGDSGNEVKTVVESSASSIVNFERGNMADWKRQLLRGSSTLVAAADAKLSELHVDTVTETSALLKANPVSNAVDSYIIAGLVDHTVIGRDVAETELDGYTDVELVSDNIADTVVVDSVLVSDIEAAAVASAVTEYEVDSSVY